MHARVAKFEGGEADAIRKSAEEIASRVESLGQRTSVETYEVAVDARM